MKRLALLCFLVFSLFFASLAFGQANVGVPVCGTATDGVTKYIPTDWATFTPPAKGVSYVDTSGGVPFGCRITRLTNGQTDFGSTTFGVTIYYDTAEPFSADDKLVMATQSGGAYYIIQNPYLTGQNGTAVPLANMPSMNNQAQPMWDRTQPELFYYTSGLQLRSAIVTGTPGCFATFNCTITTALVHDFTGTYTSLNMMDETSESVDGNHILMEGELPSTTQQVFVWNISGATSSTPYNSTCTGSVSGPNGCLHKMQISGDNNPIILYEGTGGEFLWNGTSSVCLQGSCGGGSGETSHGATGKSLTGTALWISNAGPAVLASQPLNCPISNSTYQNISVVNANSPLSATSCILDATYPPGITNWHIGYDGSASQPWVFLTWFQEGPSFNFGNSGSYASPTSSNWPLYSGEFDLTRVNNSYTSLVNANVIRLAQTRNRSQPTFWAQTFGALSFDGLYAVFSSNMAHAAAGCPSPIHASNECGDLYLVSAPSVSSFGTTGAPLFSSNGVTPPNVPSGLSSTVVGSNVTLTWTASSGSPIPTAYTVYRGTVHGGPYAIIASGLVGASYTDHSLAAGTYYYVVTAYLGGIVSSVSGNGTTATVTCTAACPTPNTSTAIIGGNSVSAFNGTFTSTGQPTSSTFTFASGTNSSGSGGGTWVSGFESGRSNEVSATAPAALTVTLSPASLTFASQLVGTSSVAQVATLTNTSSAGNSVTISGVSLGGTNPGDFSQTNTCGSSLASGTSCTISVTFSPTAAGTRTATVSVTDNATGSPQTVSLSGTATAAVAGASLSPASLSFPNQNINTTSSAQTVILTNTGTATLTIALISITGTNASQFAISANTCGASLSAGSSCNVSITFAPTVATAMSATLAFTDNAVGSPQTVSLSGTVSVPVPNVPTGLTATVNGLNVLLSWTASTGTVTGYNVQRAIVSGGPYSQIAQTFSTSYTDSGLVNGTYYYVVSAFNLTGTSANSTQASATINVAPQLVFSDQTPTFPGTFIGASSSVTVLVSNTGNANLILASSGAVTISGANSPDFVLDAATTCANSTSIAPGLSCSIVADFYPSLVGNESATLTVLSNSLVSPDSVTMFGVGLAPVTLSASSLNFGNVFVNKSSAHQTVAVTNNLPTTLTISSIVATGTGFSQTNTCGGSLASLATCTITVTFTPTSSSLSTGALTVTDSAATSPQTVSLSGSGKGRKIFKALSIGVY